jgi:uncharacterized LabA/DUF88 family protein
MTEFGRTANLAVFFDYENFARAADFDVGELLSRLKERGRLVIKRAYADWGRFAGVKQTMMRNSVELIELPSHRDGKNRADIKLVVDAMETAMTKDYIDTIVIASGDSDFIPLVAKLRELNRYVIVISSEKNSRALMAGYCDELLYYASLLGKTAASNADLAQAAQLIERVLQKLDDDGTAPTMSVVKQWMRKLDSSFNEEDCGFSQFKRFLQWLEENNHVRLEPYKSGDYLVRLPGALTTSTVATNGPGNGDSDRQPTPPKAPRSAAVESSSLTSPALSKERLLKMLVWAAHPQLVQVENTESAWISLSLVGSNLRKLFPGVTLADFGLPKKGGLARLAETLQADGYLELDTSLSENKQYMIRKTEKWPAPATTETPPAPFEDLCLNLRAHALGYHYERETLETLSDHVGQLIGEFAHNGRELSLLEVIDHVKRTQTRHDGTPLSDKLWEHVFRTLVESGALHDGQGGLLPPGNEFVTVRGCLCPTATSARVGEFIRSKASETVTAPQIELTPVADPELAGITMPN